MKKKDQKKYERDIEREVESEGVLAAPCRRMFSPSRPPALCPSGPSLQLSRTSDSESVILSGVGRRKWCQHEGCVAVRDVLTVNVIIADATECV